MFIMKILFQGDSITDAGRNREDCHDLGNGYPKFAAENIREAFPDVDIEFVNLGISGNQTKDLVDRLESDFVDVQPDIVSILIGVNDTWHHAADRSWLSNEKFEENYRTVLEAIKTRTNAKILIIEPFLIPIEDKLYFREDLDPKIQIVRKLAREYADAYLPIDGLLAAGYIGTEPTVYAADGVHPTEEGARFIADYYLEAVCDLIDEFAE